MDDLERFFLEVPMSISTEERYRRSIGIVFAGINPARLTALEFRQRLNRPEWGSSTQWVAFCAVRRFLRWRYGESHKALTLKIKRGPAEPQRVLNREQVLRLLASFDGSPKGKRDLAICTLMLDAGLRVSEICNLSMNGLDLAGRVLQVRVKGGQIKSGIFSTYTQMYLDDWLSVREAKDSTVFVSVGGIKKGYRLTRHGLQVEVRKWGKRIGIMLSPHDHRRTFAVLATHAGAPGRVLQIAGRWSSLDMVERYTGSITPAAFENYFPVKSVMD